MNVMIRALFRKIDDIWECVEVTSEDKEVQSFIDEMKAAIDNPYSTVTKYQVVVLEVKPFPSGGDSSRHMATAAAGLQV